MSVVVLYIAGAARSGSTLLSNILGEIPGVFNAGEVSELFNLQLQAVSTCGCGIPVQECNIWKPVLVNVCCCHPVVGMDALCRLESQMAHSWKLPWLMLQRRCLGWRETTGNLFKVLSSLYHSVSEVTGCRVIVDASKNSGYAFLLKNTPGIEMFLVHLVRDSRPAVFSWMNHKAGLWRENPVRASIAWDTRNLSAEMLQHPFKGRYLRIRYEDLLSRPCDYINRILSLIRLESVQTPFCGSHEVVLGLNHSIFGNPDRFKTGRIPIRDNGRWKGMPSRQWALITALTWPFLLRYGYRLWG